MVVTFTVKFDIAKAEDAIVNGVKGSTLIANSNYRALLFDWISVEAQSGLGGFASEWKAKELSTFVEEAILSFEVVEGYFPKLVEWYVNNSYYVALSRTCGIYFSRVEFAVATDFAVLENGVRTPLIEYFANLKEA
jgi:hypothetical protein